MSPAYHYPASMPVPVLVHREEARFVVSIDLSAEFGEEYEGDDDGYVWLERWRTHVLPRLARAVMTELRSDPSFSALPVSRGKHPDDEMEVAVTYKGRPSSAQG